MALQEGKSYYMSTMANAGLDDDRQRRILKQYAPEGMIGDAWMADEELRQAASVRAPECFAFGFLCK